MTTTPKERAEVMDRLIKLGIRYDEACALRRIAMTLHRWHELECGTEHGSIERDEQTGKPYWTSAWETRWATGKRCRTRVPDRETGAKKRLAKIMEKYPDLTPYIQTDPRGAALYLVTKQTLEHYQRPVDEVYSQGIAIY